MIRWLHARREARRRQRALHRWTEAVAAALGDAPGLLWDPAEGPKWVEAGDLDADGRDQMEEAAKAFARGHDLPVSWLTDIKWTECDESDDEFWPAPSAEFIEQFHRVARERLSGEGDPK